MMDLKGKIAVVTGGASGIGRALVIELARCGCRLATCDVRQPELEETRRLALDAAPDGVEVTVFLADVADEPQVLAFRDDTMRRHDTDHIHLLFNNAGIGGGGSFVSDSRHVWERTFNVCWGGVYYATRAFLPALIKAKEAHLINISSVNGFWASLGPQTAHTAYSAAKFAVKGFTEALVVDLRLNAPHVSVSFGYARPCGAHRLPTTRSPSLRPIWREKPGERCWHARTRSVRRGFGPNRRRRSSSMACEPDSGASLSARMLMRSMKLFGAQPDKAYDLDFFDRLTTFRVAQE